MFGGYLGADGYYDCSLLGGVGFRVGIWDSLGAIAVERFGYGLLVLSVVCMRGD